MFQSVSNFFLLQCNRAPYENPGDQPDEWKEEDTQREPCERETKHARRHRVGEVIVQQRESQERDQKGRCTRHGQAPLAPHEFMKKFLAVNVLVLGCRWGGHGKTSSRNSRYDQALCRVTHAKDAFKLSFRYR